MIERKFGNESVRLFGHQIFISDDEEWGVANPRPFNSATDSVNIYEYFEEKGYNFLFSAGDVLYFRRKKQK